jgi:hypothetical protein
MIENGRPVTRQMLNELDGVPVDPVQQLGQSLLAFMQRQVAQGRAEEGEPRHIADQGISYPRILNSSKIRHQISLPSRRPVN